MPELPEVEIVRQSLNKKIKKKSIKKVIIRNRNLRFKIPSNFENFIKNKKIIKVNRFSKYLILHFQKKEYFLIHLGMSGKIQIKEKKKKIKTATLFKKKKSTFNPDFCANKLPDNPWIVQPFEIYEELRIEEIKKKHQK